MSERSSPSEYAYLAYLTEDREVGESTKRSPQHLTLVPPFPFDLSLAKVQEAVHEVAADTKPFQVKVANEVKFGSNYMVTVRIIEPAGIVRALHYQLMYSLHSRGIPLPSKFVYETYSPHITVKPAHPTELSTGQIMTIDHIAIMHKDKGYRTLLAREELSGEETTA